MSDKTLLHYKGNLDVSDIPGALTGSKSGILSKISGRDYINVHDIPGAIPKINVGYTGNYRLDEQGVRDTISQNQNPMKNQELIGRPKLKNHQATGLNLQLGGMDQQSSQGNSWSAPNQAYNSNQQHQRSGSLQIPEKRSEYYHGNYNMLNGQQVDHAQVYNAFKNKDQQTPNGQSNYNSQGQLSSSLMERKDLFSQTTSLNDRLINQDLNSAMKPNYGQENNKYKKNNHVRYEDALDKFMISQTSREKLDIPTLLKREQQTLESKLSQYKSSVPAATGHDSLSSPRGLDQNLLSQQSGGLLTSRNSVVAKSTANLILKPKQQEEGDIFATLGQRQTRNNHFNQAGKQNENQSYNNINRTKQEHSPTFEGSPNQVQKKIKELQTVRNEKGVKEDIYNGGTLHNTNYLDQVSSTSDILKSSLKSKPHGLFNINPSTVPDDGKFDVKQAQGSIKRSLALAPSTQLGQHHKEEIDDSIQKREYTKLGGGNLQVQMPTEINNIQYHRQNPMKDYTYSAFTGAYYYRAPN